MSVPFVNFMQRVSKVIIMEYLSVNQKKKQQQKTTHFCMYNNASKLVTCQKFVHVFMQYIWF